MEFDHFTKWVKTAIIHNKTADNILHIAKALIVGKHGISNEFYLIVI